MEKRLSGPDAFRSPTCGGAEVFRGPAAADRPCCLAGHTDVVPTGPVTQWATPPSCPRTATAASLWPRRRRHEGSSRLRGGLGALRRRIHARHRASALLLTSDEEGPAVDGTVRVSSACSARRAPGLLHRRRADLGQRAWATRSRTAAAARRARLTVAASRATSPTRTVGATRSTSLALALAELVAERMGRGQRVLSAHQLADVNIHAGTGAGNVIPGRAGGGLNFRFSTESRPQSLPARQGVAGPARLDYELQWTLGGEPFLTTPRAPGGAERRHPGETGSSRPSCPPPAAPATAASSPIICPQDHGSSAWSTRPSTRSTSMSRWRVEPLKNIYRRTLETLLT